MDSFSDIVVQAFRTSIIRPCSFQWEMTGVGWVSVGKAGKEWVRVGKSGIFFFKCGKGGKEWVKVGRS